MEEQYNLLQDIIYDSVFLLAEYKLEVDIHFYPSLEKIDIGIPVQKGLTKNYSICVNDVEALRTVRQELKDIELDLEKKKQETDFLG